MTNTNVSKSVSKKCFSLNATDHDMDHRHVDHRLTARREVFVVFAQPAVFPKPAEGAFHHPPFWQQDEAFGLIRALDDLQTNPATGTKPEQPCGKETRIRAIGPNQTQSRQAMTSHGQSHSGTITILKVCTRDHDSQQES